MDRGAWQATVHRVAETHHDGSNLAGTHARTRQFLLSLFQSLCSSSFKNFIHLFLAALGLLCGVQAFSSCGEWALLSSRAPCCSSFPGRGAQALGSMGLVALHQAGSSWTRDGTCAPSTGRIPNHRTTSKVPLCSSLAH